MDRRLLGFAAGLVFCAAGCSSTTNTNSNPINIGALLSQTGSCATLGAPAWNGVKMAVDEINDAGGVLGRPLVATLKDDQTVPDAAVSNAAALAALGVGAIIGTSCSSEALATANEVTIPGNIVLISPSATATAYSALHANGGLTFRTISSDGLQAAVLTELAEDAGFHDIAVLYDSTQAYSNGLAAGIAADIPDAGGVITRSLGYTPGQTDYTPQLRQLFDAGTPQAVAFFAYLADGPTVINDYATTFKSLNVTWLLTDSLDSPQFATGLGSNSNIPIRGTIGATPTGALYQTFSTNFVARYSQSALLPYAANGYDAVYMVALAIQAKGKTDGPSIAAGLTAIGTGSGAPINPGQFAQAAADLDAGQAIKYGGASGPCTFDPNGDVVDGYSVWTVDGGTIQTIIDYDAP